MAASVSRVAKVSYPSGFYGYNATGYQHQISNDPRPHGVTSISGGVINTSFTYDAKGNMTSGNGLSVTYTPFNKPETITRGTTQVAFQHDPEHQRFAQTSPSGVTLYFSGMGVLAEKFGQLGGPQRWTNLPDGGRAHGRHPRGECRREHADALPRPAPGQASTPTTWAPSPSSATRPAR